MKFVNTKKHNKFYFPLCFIAVSIVLLNECVISPSHAMMVARKRAVKEKVTMPIPEKEESLSLPVVALSDATTTSTNELPSHI
ncbi:MAG: hypothetical protein HQK51_17355 [Oligoflexia bacterium]|nr:hypothetical protein [Oligoflexia bacterium]